MSDAPLQSSLHKDSPPQDLLSHDDEENQRKADDEPSSSLHKKLNSVLQLFSDHPELSEDRAVFLKLLFDQILKVTNADLLLLFRWNAKGQDWSLLHYHGLPRYVIKNGDLNLPRAWQSLPTIILHEGYPLFSDDISKDRRFIGQVIRGMSLRSFGGVTLQSKASLYGSLSIAFMEPSVLTPNDQQLFLMLSELLTPYLLHQAKPGSRITEAHKIEPMVLSLDMSGRIQDCNDRLADFFGNEKGQLQKKPLSHYLTSAGCSNYLKSVKQLKEGEEIVSLSLAIKLEAGRIRTLKTQLTLIKKEETPIGIELTAEDVTEISALQKEIVYKDALLAISQSVFGSITTSTEKALKEAVIKGVSLLDFDGATLYRFNRDKRQLRLVVHQDGSSSNVSPIEKLGAEDKKHIIWKVVDRGERAFLTVKPKEAPLKKRLVGEEGLLSYLAVPIESEGQLWGVFSLFSRTKRFSEVDLHFLASLGEEIGIVIDQLASLDRLKKEIELLSILNEVGQSIIKSLHMEQLLPSIANCLKKMIGASNSYIFLGDAKRHLYVGAAASDQRSEAIRKLEVKMNENSLVPITARERHAFAIEKASQDSRVTKKWIKTFRSRSLLSVPLISKERAIGVLLLDETRYFRKFKEDEIERIVSMADQVSVAIENAILHHSVSRHLERLQTLSSAIVNIQEEERRRIAKKLRNETGEVLKKIRKDITWVQETVEGQTPEIKDCLDQIALQTEKTMEALQTLSCDLRPAGLDESGLVSTLKSYIKEFEGQNDTKVHLQINGAPKRFPGRLEILLFRILQEALANIATHAKAESAIVSLEKRDPHVHLYITDDGKGFDVKRYFSSSQPTRKGIGILGMKERVELAGGTFYIDSHPGQGTRISVRIPVVKRNPHS